MVENRFVYTFGQCLNCLIYCFTSTVNILGYVGMVSFFTTLFLGKPHGGSLPASRAHSFERNRQLAVLESAEDRNEFSTKEFARPEGRSRNCLNMKRTRYRPSYRTRFGQCEIWSIRHSDDYDIWLTSIFCLKFVNSLNFMHDNKS